MRRRALALVITLTMVGCGLHRDVARQIPVNQVGSGPTAAAERVVARTRTAQVPAASPHRASPRPAASATPSTHSVRSESRSATTRRPQVRAQPADDRETADARDALWGRSFASVRMKEGGAVRPHALGIRMLLHFWQEDGAGRMRVHSGCYGAVTSFVKVARTRLRVSSDDSAYAPGCRWKEVTAQDVWFGQLVDARPRWRLSDDGHLVMSAGKRSIVFAPHSWAAPWPGDEPAPGADLWGRSFASVRITEDGKKRAPADGARILVNPYRRDGTGQLRYNGGCNTGGGRLRITATRFRIGERGATAMMCSPDGRMDQEAWFTEFLDTDPHWRWSEDRMQLLLFNDNVSIAFEDHHWPPPWRADGDR